MENVHSFVVENIYGIIFLYSFHIKTSKFLWPGNMSHFRYIYIHCYYKGIFFYMKLLKKGRNYINGRKPIFWVCLSPLKLSKQKKILLDIPFIICTRNGQLQPTIVLVFLILLNACICQKFMNIENQNICYCCFLNYDLSITLSQIYSIFSFFSFYRQIPFHEQLKVSNIKSLG